MLLSVNGESKSQICDAVSPDVFAKLTRLRSVIVFPQTDAQTQFAEDLTHIHKLPQTAFAAEINAKL